MYHLSCGRGSRFVNITISIYELCLVLLDMSIQLNGTEMQHSPLTDAALFLDNCHKPVKLLKCTAHENVGPSTSILTRIFLNIQMEIAFHSSKLPCPFIILLLHALLLPNVLWHKVWQQESATAWALLSIQFALCRPAIRLQQSRARASVRKMQTRQCPGPSIAWLHSLKRPPIRKSLLLCRHLEVFC